MDALQRLLDIEELRNLKARYFRCMDTKDWDGLTAVFAPDAVFDLREVYSVRNPRTGVWDPPYGGDDVVFRGRDKLMKMIRDSVQYRTTIHHGHMGEIEITGPNSARGIWAMADIVLSVPGDDDPIDMRGSGHYHDTYVRLPQGWAIESTRITRLILDR
ncbi:MAG: DUF4440 domain-containing protein [Alphaproteobacteria bacterium]|nr:DUF4440 domain-containing protein [Alphaproteobacteria bacterium]